MSKNDEVIVVCVCVLLYGGLKVSQCDWIIIIELFQLYEVWLNDNLLQNIERKIYCGLTNLYLVG